MKRKSLLIILLLSITASFTWYMSKKSMFNEASPVTNISNGGFSLYKTKIHITDKNGQLIYSILAEKAYQDPVKKLLELDDISIDELVNYINILKKEIDRVEDVKNEKSKALELAKDYFKK